MGITDCKSWPILTIWDIEGDADGGTLGMKRDISATDDILTVSSSMREFAENSCIERHLQVNSPVQACKTGIC